MSGLLNKDKEYINKALSQVEKIDSAILFGSRAMGNYKKGSDVDLAVKGEALGFYELSILDDLLNEEYPLPYFFDIVDYHSLSNQALKKHIDEYGVMIYQKEESCGA
ncbi:nucleotidyltransferase domain-containing protein [Halobacillus trueperi]|uniref:Predicted nucleotidyltransferase n=2 Tax=Halobacillus TaxID=45667 RepID=A0A1H0KHV9_HALAD|nr:MULTISPECIES: nucleotidyltransferase domain-containing protein [Halobacillus]RDY71679.1 nucleotidyltransferase domain-containing protein [Halobacillus trueperi]SDO55475.1 Predicted nucleotidyltransferase [Halobacillus aidingensis]